MEEITPAELATLATAASAALVLVLKTLFGGCHESRCTSIETCYGCIKLSRNVAEPNESDEENGDGERAVAPNAPIIGRDAPAANAA
jgi:hypothetical protein